MGKMVKPTIFAIALTSRIDEGEITGLASAVRGFGLSRQMQLLERDGDLLSKPDANESSGRDRIAVADKAHGFGRAHHLSLLGGPQIRQYRMLRHLSSPLSGEVFSVCLPAPCRQISS